jgi:uncharacterized protein (TIGR00251 family)
MKISILVKTKAKENGVEKINDNNYIVRTKKMPVEGKANESVIKILANFFNIAPSRIQIISGKRSKRKIIEIL